MPIEIKELHIKINVDEQPQGLVANDNQNFDKEEIIETCVEQVMEILSQKEER